MGSVARRFHALNRRLFRRVGRGEIRSALERIGLARGDTVWARISMRSLGYVSGGPQEVIEAIRDVIGEAGTLVTAAWPFAEPCQAERSKLFDVAETPSAAGLLSETLRRLPGACRSLHPIASVVAIGEAAEALTRGHEMARTPFGDESPYGRLASSAPRLLLVGAHLGGILYHVQDKVGFPNLYAPEPAVFESRDAQRRSRTIRTSVLRPDVAPVIILPGSRPETREYLLVADYALIFPLERERRLMEAGYLRFN
ncbi:MAG TPA: AAC(3) family N-acetyltransferase, partial [Candidatus Polarisedimenticolia bacterium]|nr:AAC(3) family N-acetyltransferase [Candidatus Polarisedimenticolia bacterium]